MRNVPPSSVEDFVPVFPDDFVPFAADVGFDWSDASGALDKVDEEAAELRAAVANQDKENIAEELGDLLFSAVNVSRFVKVDAEEALTAASDKFLLSLIHI